MGLKQKAPSFAHHRKFSGQETLSVLIYPAKHDTDVAIGKE